MFDGVMNYGQPSEDHIDGLMQERRNSSVLAMGLRHCSIGPSIS